MPPGYSSRDDRCGIVRVVLSAAFPCGPVTHVVRFAEIGRCEQSYTDAYWVLPSHQPPTHECPRGLADLSLVGHCPALRRAPRTRGLYHSSVGWAVTPHR